MASVALSAQRGYTAACCHRRRALAPAGSLVVPPAAAAAPLAAAAAGCATGTLSPPVLPGASPAPAPSAPLPPSPTPGASSSSSPPRPRRAAEQAAPAAAGGGGAAGRGEGSGRPAVPEGLGAGAPGAAASGGGPARGLGAASPPDLAGLLNIGDMVHYMHRRRKGPPVVLKDSFGVVVTDELVVTKSGGREALPEQTYGVVDTRSGELTRRVRESMVSVERVLAPASPSRPSREGVGGRGGADEEPRLVCSSVLDLVELRWAQVRDLVRTIFLEVEPLPREELQPLIDSGNAECEKLLSDRRHVGRMISRLFLKKRNTHTATWAQVAALGRLFVELTAAAKELPPAPPRAAAPPAPAAARGLPRGASTAAPPGALVVPEDSWGDLDEEGPSFEELLAQIKQEVQGKSRHGVRG